jgi:hypothetical protein
VGLPNETDQALGQVKKRSECPSSNRKRASACLAEGGQKMGARTNQRGKATSSSSTSVEEDGGGHVEGDSKPSLVTSGARIGSSPGQEVFKSNSSSVEEDGGGRDEDGGGRGEEDSKPSLVTSGARRGSSPGQEAVQEEATPDQVPSEIPSGWKRVKLEPDC